MTLRERILSGGAYLVARQGLGLVIGLGGMMLLTRLIGPGNYGLYNSTLAVMGYLSSVGMLGLNVFLVRQKGEIDRYYYDQAFSLLLLTSMVVVIVGVGLSPLLAIWLRNPDFARPFVAMLLTLPLGSVIFPSLARLERDLNYRTVAMLELVGQLVYYIVALTLAWGGFGVWGPVAGYWVQQLWLVLGVSFLSRFTPRWCWSWERVREMIGYGLGYSSSIWVWQLRSLVNPLIVGRYAGPDAVGYVALAIRLVEALSFVKGVTWRISLAALAKLQHDSLRLKRALDEAMTLQVLATGPFLVGFSTLASLVIPFIFGSKWGHVQYIFPYIALSYLINAVFNMHSSVLYVLEKNWDVTWFHIGHIILFAVGALILVPRLGIIGYGWAEVIAILSYAIIHQRVTASDIVPSYKWTLLWLLAFVPPLFTSVIGFPQAALLYIPAAVVFVIPAVRSQVFGYLTYFHRRTHEQSAIG